MSEENKKDEEELDESEEELDESEEELDEDEESEDEGDESKGSNIDALTGLAGAAASALANKGNKKPVKGKVTAKSKKGSKTVSKSASKPTSKPAPSISKDGSVDVNAKIDEIQKLTDKNTVWTVAGYSFTPAKLMILGTILSSALGGLYGAFEVYKDYQAMKKQITNYVAPDLSVFDKRLEIVAEKAEKSVQYTQDIKNDLKQDIRRLEGTVEQVERSSKQSQRETDISVKEVQSELRQTRKELDVAIKDINSNVDKKIQRALDNPLAGK
jgi:hypothetical protein